MERKLFFAYDENGKRVVIDSLKLDSDIKKKEFFCPYCKSKVIPKMGKKNAWHFSHAGDVCDYLKKKKEDLNDLSLDNFSQKTIDTKDIKFETDKFTCLICKDPRHKSNGFKLGKGWICKECYKSANPDKINKLL